MGYSHPSPGERNLFGLAPGGVYQATPITQGTGELLPHLFTLTPTSVGTVSFSVALSLPRPVKWRLRYFTERNSPNYGPPCPVELGLSSPP
jgi:hypothetical protein